MLRRQRNDALLTRDHYKLRVFLRRACEGPGLHVVAAFWKKACRRDLETPEGHDDRADLEARRLFVSPEHER
jgi:hypothetical protein